MGGLEWILEAVLVALLAATLVHALRLERALGVLKRDRAALEELVAGFNASTRQAEDGIERLRQVADGAGRHVARQIETASALREDLGFLIDRAERMADRLDQQNRTARSGGGEPVRLPSLPVAAPDPEPADGPRVRSQAERDLLRALRVAR